MRYVLPMFIVIITFSACQESGELPIYGLRYKEDGVEKIRKIPDFKFVDQLGDSISNADLEGKIYVADFFFTTCPTICGKIKQQELRIAERFKDEPNFAILSHTIDPKHDTVEKLKKYADKLEVDHNRWHFVNGPKEVIYDIDEAYLSIAMESDEAPGGFDHSNRVILVDKDRQVRSHAIGTDPKDVDRFMKDIQTLLDEYKTK